MDPNLFYLDWERTFEALVGIIVLSFFIERTLSLVFESTWWIRQFEDPRIGRPLPNHQKPDGASEANVNNDENEATISEVQKPLPAQRVPLKEALSFILALVICRVWDFDAVSIVLLSEHTQLVGIIITAGIIAGGSKGSIALFHNLLGIRSSADKARQELKEKDKKA